MGYNKVVYIAQYLYQPDEQGVISHEAVSHTQGFLGIAISTSGRCLFNQVADYKKMQKRPFILFFSVGSEDLSMTPAARRQSGTNPSIRDLTISCHSQTESRSNKIQAVNRNKEDNYAEWLIVGVADIEER